jgi:hypothetical protein
VRKHAQYACALFCGTLLPRSRTVQTPQAKQASPNQGGSKQSKGQLAVTRELAQASANGHWAGVSVVFQNSSATDSS